MNIQCNESATRQAARFTLLSICGANRDGLMAISGASVMDVFRLANRDKKGSHCADQLIAVDICGICIAIANIN